MAAELKRTIKPHEPHPTGKIGQEMASRPWAQKKRIDIHYIAGAREVTMKTGTFKGKKMIMRRF